MGIMDKLQKNSRIKETDILNKSKIFSKQEMVTTSVPMINVALSGDPDGGLTSGLTVLAGPSKNFKTSFGLLMAAAFLNKYDEYYIDYDSFEAIYRTKKKTQDITMFYGTSFYEAIGNKLKNFSYNELLNLGVNEKYLKHLYNDLQMQEYLVGYWNINNFEMFELEVDNPINYIIIKSLKERIDNV
jgi:hypothetical protein